MLLLLGIHLHYQLVVEGAKATDHLLSYFFGGSYQINETTRSDHTSESLLDRLSGGEWLFALFAAIVLNIPLLLLSSFFIDRKRFAVTFAALFNSRELFTGLLFSSGLKVNWPMQLRMLNDPQFQMILNLRRPPLTQHQVTRLLTVFEQYAANLEEQNNQSVLFWLHFKLTIQEQNFVTGLLRCPLYRDYELTSMVRRARAKLHFIEKLEQIQPKQQQGCRLYHSSAISAVSSISERQQSKFEEIWTKLEESMKNKIDPNSHLEDPQW